MSECRFHYNMGRPHSALGYRPPAPVTIAPPPALDGTANMP
ncbi:MAG: integrase core domain-containing protein [Aestuariivirga sp.]